MERAIVMLPDWGKGWGERSRDVADPEGIVDESGLF